VETVLQGIKRRSCTYVCSEVILIGIEVEDREVNLICLRRGKKRKLMLSWRNSSLIQSKRLCGALEFET
jgi:hypothetical protein